MTAPASHDADDIAARAAATVCAGILQQLALVRLTEDPFENPISIKSQAGSVHAIVYMIGYSKAVHRFYEATTGVHINDGTMGLAALGSIFRGSTIEECLEARGRAMDALEADLPGTREMFAIGQKDYDSLGDGEVTGHSGLVTLLGVGGMA